MTKVSRFFFHTLSTKAVRWAVVLCQTLETSWGKRKGREGNGEGERGGEKGEGRREGRGKGERKKNPFFVSVNDNG